MDILGLTKSVLIMKVSRSACILKDYLGTITKCMDYTGVLKGRCNDMEVI